MTRKIAGLPKPGQEAASARSRLDAAAQAVTAAASEIPRASELTTSSLTDIRDAHDRVTKALAEFDAAVRDRVKDDPLAESIAKLLSVAAVSESLREWFPVDPEMTPVRGTVLVPQIMSSKKPEAPPAKKPEDEDLAVLVKRLLGHLASS
ncbi:hypothetical protein [Microbacterium atlanticum]|uniref:hypothetical protein n=1 Tax=Microbacterium atlanticum TaxID=2782168 RepID=UPI00188847FE|nr:hypothetical protein [Microbacterium atlanticum]